MSPHYSVLATKPAGQSGAVAAVVASLPETFGPGGADADVRAISGAPGWTAEARAALDDGARGLVVVGPAAEDATALAGAASAAGVPVIIDYRWASNAALALSETPLKDALDDSVLLDSVATAGTEADVDCLLVEHLALLSKVAPDAGAYQLLRQGPRGYTVAGTLPNGASVMLHGILTDARPAGAEVSLLSADGGVQISLPDPDTARPAQSTVTSGEGALSLPTIFESSHRTSWLRLKKYLAAGKSAPDLTDFTEVVLTFSQLH